MSNKNLPIGYWIKQADNLLTRGIDEIYRSAGISRTGWQILETVHENHPVPPTQVIALLKPFEEQQRVEEIIVRLTGINLIEHENEGLMLTDEGEKLYQQCRQKQNAFHSKAGAGISGDEYEATLKVLQQIVENLQAK